MTDEGLTTAPQTAREHAERAAELLASLYAGLDIFRAGERLAPDHPHRTLIATQALAHAETAQALVATEPATSPSARVMLMPREALVHALKGLPEEKLEEIGAIVGVLLEGGEPA